MVLKRLQTLHNKRKGTIGVIELYDFRNGSKVLFQTLEREMAPPASLYKYPNTYSYKYCVPSGAYEVMNVNRYKVCLTNGDYSVKPVADTTEKLCSYPSIPFKPVKKKEFDGLYIHPGCNSTDSEGCILIVGFFNTSSYLTSCINKESSLDAYNLFYEIVMHNRDKQLNII